MFMKPTYLVVIFWLDGLFCRGHRRVCGKKHGQKKPIGTVRSSVRRIARPSNWTPGSCLPVIWNGFGLPVAEKARRSTNSSVSGAVTASNI